MPIFKPNPPTPFFLCGFGKSGTNWVANLLNLHPAILCDGEWHFQHFLHAWEEFAKYPWQLGSRQPARHIAREHVERLIRECLSTMADRKPGVRLVGDRSPRPLQELIRGAKTIYVYRDGRDVLVSYTFHHLRAGKAHHFPEHLRESFTRHKHAFQQDPDAMSPDNPGLLADEAWVRETARFWAWRVLDDIKHGAGTETDTLLNIRYEDLHQDLTSQCTRMYALLGVDPHKATPPTLKTGTATGFSQENRKSLYRKGAVGDWQRFASPEFVQWSNEEACEALEQLGYTSQQSVRQE